MLPVEVCALYLTEHHTQNTWTESVANILSLLKLLLSVLKKQNLVNTNLQFLLTSFLGTAISKNMSVPVVARSKV